MHYVHDFMVHMLHDAKLIANVHEFTNSNSSIVDVYLVYPNGSVVLMGQKEYDTTITGSFQSVEDITFAKSCAMREVLQDVDYRLHELARLTEKVLYGKQ